MSYTAEIKVEDSKRKTIIAVCEECGRETVHTVLTDVSSQDQSPDGDIHVWDNYRTIMCRGCQTLSFCREAGSSEDIGRDGTPITTTTLFPSRIARRSPLADLYHLPSELRQVYQETRSALMNDLPILAGIGIRAIVETVCNEKRCSSQNLKGKIQQLVDAGIITGVDGEILHSLRFMGNEAAHKAKTHKQNELNVAFDVAEHLLDSVYLLPKRAKHLPNRAGTSKRPDEG
jgi:predicted RNA-binding protein Jag